MAPGQREIVEAPVLKRRRLRTALRDGREAAGLSQGQVSTALAWSVSKVIRIETGAVGVSVTDLRALIDLYKITDKSRQDELDELARGSRKEPWSEYSDVYDAPARKLFGYEAAASVISKYEPTLVPGILQTEEYANAILKSFGHSEQKIEKMVRGRLERQDLLERKSSPELRFILGEAAVSRAVGGREVMRRQLERLKEFAERPKISLQVLLFDAGAHPRIGEAFTVLEFPGDLDDLLYRENARAESINQEDPELAAAYLEDFAVLQQLATPSRDFATVIDKIVEMRLALQSNIKSQGEEP